MLLKDIIDKFVGRPIKIGGSYGGFIFCGYIRDNYKELFEELDRIEENKSKDRIKRAQKEKRTIIAQRDKMKDKMIAGHLDKAEIDAYLQICQEKLTVVEARIQKAENEKVTNCDLLSMEVINKYRSNVDGSIILILDYKAYGKFVDRNECISDESFKSLVEKYNI